MSALLLDAIPSLWRASDLERSAAPACPSGFAALDAELPGGGWPCGQLTEVLQPEAGWREWRLLAPSLARLSQQGAVVLVGPPLVPHLPALAWQGLALEALIWVQANSPAERLWAAEQALRCQALSALLVWLPQAVSPGLSPGLPALPVGAAPLGGPAAGLARAAAPGFACRACGCPGGAGAQTPWPAAGAVLAVACGPAFALACRSGGGAAPHTAPHTVTDHGGPVTQPFQAGSPCGGSHSCPTPRLSPGRHWRGGPWATRRAWPGCRTPWCWKCRPACVCSAGRRPCCAASWPRRGPWACSASAWRPQPWRPWPWRVPCPLANGDCAVAMPPGCRPRWMPCRWRSCLRWPGMPSCCSAWAARPWARCGPCPVPGWRAASEPICRTPWTAPTANAPRCLTGRCCPNSSSSTWSAPAWSSMRPA